MMAEHPKNQSGHSQSDNLVKPGSTMDPKGGAAAQQGMQNQQEIQNLKDQQGRQGGQQQSYQGVWPQNQLSEQDQRQMQERQQQAWDAAAEREKSNNPATKDQRTYGKDAPGMDPRNQPAPDTKMYKATRLDLEDITGNPGHRGVNPDAPANSINRQPADRGGNLESINEPSHVTQGWPQRGQQSAGPGGSDLASINEPPGSQVIPPGAGQGAGGAAGGIGTEYETPEIEELEPDEVEAGSAPDITMHVHGTGFTDKSVITFNGHDEPTVFVSDTEVTTIVKPSLFTVPAVCPVTVKNGGYESEEVEFEFLEAETPAASRQSKRAKPKPPGKGKGKKAKGKR